MAKTTKKRQATTNRRLQGRREAPQVQKETKKQVAFRRKEARQRRIIWLSVIGLGVIVLIVLGIALIQELVVKPGKPVARVNGAEISVVDYQALLAYQRHNLHLDISNLETGMQSLDPSDETNEFLISFYQQQLSQLETALTTAPDDALETLIDDELIRQKASELKLTVTAAEVEETINEDIRQAVSQYSQEVLTDTEQLPTPTPIPQDEIDQFYKSAIDNMGLSNREYRAIVQRSLLRSKVQEHLASQVPTTGLVVHLLMIQTSDEQAALTAKQRVENGEDFATVAREVSISSEVEETGGDMGWVAPGQLTSRYGEELDTLIFSLAVGEIGQVQSAEQFFVVQVLEKDENGPLPSEVLTPRRNSALEDWLAERKSSPEVQIERLLQPDQIPADPLAQAQGF